jgi:hypothetical protein
MLRRLRGQPLEPMDLLPEAIIARIVCISHTVQRLAFDCDADDVAEYDVAFFRIKGCVAGFMHRRARRARTLRVPAS